MDAEKKRTTILMIERASQGESLEEMLKAIKQSRKLPQILLPKMGGMSNEVLADLAGCSRAYVYGIMKGVKHPEKDLLLRIAFVLGMSVEETQEMLQTARRAPLSPKDKRDICVIFGLANGLDLETMDEVLTQQGQKPLFPDQKEESGLWEMISFHLERTGMSEDELLTAIQCSPEDFRAIVEEETFPSRDLLLRIALTLGMELPETQNMLKTEKMPVLSVRDERDMYIMNGIANRVSPKELDAKLTGQGMEPLWRNSPECSKGTVQSIRTERLL